MDEGEGEKGKEQKLPSHEFKLKVDTKGPLLIPGRKNVRCFLDWRNILSYAKVT